MLRSTMTSVFYLFGVWATSSTAYAQSADADALIPAEQAALRPLDALDGAWRGDGWTVSSSGESTSFTQTERVGPFLESSIKVIEGRGYAADGSLKFNALGTISYDPDSQTYTMHSYAEGRVGDFILTLTADGFEYTIPEGPSSTHYSLVVKNGSWREVGDRLVAGEPPVRIFETNLQRLADTDWPAAGAICAGH